MAGGGNGWRFYVRRPFGGPWLSTDLPLEASVTTDLSGPGMLRGMCPVQYDPGHLAADGRPFFLERGTLIYAEHGGYLERGGVFALTHTSPAPGGRNLEGFGLSGAFRWMPYAGEFRRWHPHPYDVVDELVTHGQAYDNGKLGFTVKRVSAPPRMTGDPQPPDRPRKPGRRRRESKEAYDDRLLKWEMAVDAWEEEYKDHEPYELVWWESPMIGEELDELAAEVPFDYREVHTWTNRENLTHTSVLELGGRLGRRREDVKLVDGINLTETPAPVTSADTYANDYIVLGSGEGRDMRQGRAAVNDGRIRSARFVSAKDTRSKTRLAAKAQAGLAASGMVTRVESVKVWDVGGFAPVSSLEPGDEVHVTSKRVIPTFEGWVRIAGVTRSTETPETELRFTREGQ